jgi:hypothetical protein
MEMVAALRMDRDLTVFCLDLLAQRYGIDG